MAVALITMAPLFRLIRLLALLLEATVVVALLKLPEPPIGAAVAEEEKDFVVTVALMDLQEHLAVQESL